MTATTTPEGYQDRYDRIIKAWKKILARPDRAIQVAELIELQSIIQSENQQMGIALFTEGGLISGGSAAVAADRTAITISASQIYALAVVHDIPELLDFPITGSGEEQIGVLITPAVISEEDDPDLLDPAVGYEGTGYPGAHRLAYEYEYVINDPTAIRVVSLLDGQIDQTFNQLRPLLKSLLELLAKRTYEQSGHYTVEQFRLSIFNLDRDDTNYNDTLHLRIEGGLAYVKGWRVENEVTSLSLTRPVASFSRFDEPKTYIPGQSFYSLNDSPIREVEALMATIESEAIPMIRGSVFSGMDELPVEYQPVVAIQAITTGAPPPGGTPFVEDTDFTLNGNYVDWSPAGAEPAPGETYYLVVHYVKQLTKASYEATSQAVELTRSFSDTDTLPISYISRILSVSFGTTVYTEGRHFVVDAYLGTITWISDTRPMSGLLYSIVFEYWVEKVAGDYIARNSFVDADAAVLYDCTPTKTHLGVPVDYKKQIVFTASGNKPVPEMLFYVDYRFALPREDLLVVDYRGFLRVLEGEPSKHPVPATQKYSMLRLARLSLPAEARAKDISIELTDVERLTMTQLRTLLGEVKDIQYNQAVAELDTEASAMSLPTEKRGIFSDRFSNLDKADLGSAETDCTIDVLLHALLLPQVEQTSPLVAQAPIVRGSFVMSYSSVLELEQIYATETIQANPYTLVSFAAEITIDPQEDRWETSQEITVRGPDTVVTVAPRVIRNRVTLRQLGNRTGTRPIGGSWAARGGLQRIVPNSDWLSVRRLGSRTIERGSRMEQVSKTMNDVMESVEIDLIPTARQIAITVEGSGFLPDETNIQARFGVAKVSLTPAAGYREGIKGGTVLADSEGKFKASFLSPPGAATGMHEVTCHGSTTTGGAGSRATATFFSEGRHKTTTKVVTFTKTERRVTELEVQTAAWVPPPPPPPPPRVRFSGAAGASTRKDPVAQTFSAPKSFMLTQLNIFFRAKAANPKEAVEVLVVTVQDGYPTTTILGLVKLFPDQVSISEDASTATVFSFPQPIFIEAKTEYAFIIRCDVPDYILHIARVGSLDPVNGWVDENPNTGIMLTSANMITWTPEQNADVKFSMFRAKYQPTQKELLFDPILFDHAINRFELAVQVIEPNEDCVVLWQYSKDGVLWFDFMPPLEVDIGKPSAILYFKAILMGTEYLMPILSDTPMVNGYYWKTTGAYLARQFVLWEPDCRYVDVWLDEELPGNTEVALQVNFDDGNGWQDMTHLVLEDKPITGTKTERHYHYDTGSDLDLKQKIQVRVNMSSSSNYITPQLSRLRVVTSTI